MSGKKIYVVAGDRGGWNALEPPLIKALNAGCEVTVYFVGTCVDQYRSGILKLDGRLRVITGDQMTPENFVAEPHDLTVLGASQTDGSARAVAQAGYATTAPIQMVEDLYGSALPTLKLLQGSKRFSKTRVCVTDAFAHDQLIDAFVPEAQIAVTGGPQFDKVIEVKKNWMERRQQLRHMMKVEDDELVFLVAGQLNGTAEAVMLVREMALKQKYRVRLLVRQNPRATWLDDALLGSCHGSIPLSYFIEVPRTMAAASEDFLPAVDFVLSGYGPTNHFGILYGMRGVVYVGTPSFRWDLWHEKGLEKPPEVEAGAAWYVETPDDLAHVVQEVQKGNQSDELLRIIHAQSIIAAYNDGHAADRVWVEMQELMGG